MIIGILQYAGLYIQLNAALNVGHGEVDNYTSGNGEFVLCLCLLLVSGLEENAPNIIISTLEEEWLGGVFFSFFF